MKHQSRPSHRGWGLGIAVTVALVVAAYVVDFGAAAPTPGAASTSAPRSGLALRGPSAAVQMDAFSARKATPNPWSLSPFGSGTPSTARLDPEEEADYKTMVEAPGRAQPAPAPAPLEAATLAEAERKMRALGYGPSPQTEGKSPSALMILASAGNAEAKAEIAERYMHASPSERSHTPSNGGLTSPAQAQAWLLDAVASGHIRSASLMAELAQSQHRQEDSYAWYLVAEHLGDSYSSQTFRNAEWYLEADDPLKRAAQAKLPTLLADIEARKSAATTR